MGVSENMVLYPQFQWIIIIFPISPLPAVCPISAGQIHILHGQSTMCRDVSSSTYLNPLYPPSLSRLSPVEVAKVKWIWRLVLVV